MLPGIGSSELFVIALVALIVVGPKDLPVMLRKLGQWVAKMRSMANEFRASFDEMARQSELDELRKEVQALRTGQFTDPFRQATEDAANVGVEQVFADIDAGLKGGEMQMHPPMSYQYDTPSEPEPVDDSPKPKRAPAKAKSVNGPVAKAPARAVAKKAPAAKASAAKATAPKATKVASPAARPRKKNTGTAS